MREKIERNAAVLLLTLLTLGLLMLGNYLASLILGTRCDMDTITFSMAFYCLFCVCAQHYRRLFCKTAAPAHDQTPDPEETPASSPTPDPEETPEDELSLDRIQNKLKISALYNWSVHPDDREVLCRLCIEYAERLHAAARAGSFDLLEVDMENEWKLRSSYAYPFQYLRVTINDRDYNTDGFVKVMFDAVPAQTSREDSPKF